MPTRGFSRYRALVDHLAVRPECEITCTFAEIEAILGRSLPVSPYVDARYWHSEMYEHVRRWRALGWRATFDRRNRCVHFTRDAEE